MIQYIKFGQNPSFGSGDRVQTICFWSKFVKVLLWHWKRGQCHQKLTISFPCPNGVYVQVWLKSIHLLRRERADKAYYYSLYSVVTLKIRSNLLTIKIIQYITFGQSPSFGSRDRVQTSFWSKFDKVLLWPWKRGQCHQNLNTSFPCPNGVYVQVWLKSIHWFRRETTDKA